MSGCKGILFTADSGKSRGKCSDGRGEAPKILVKDLGINGLEFRLLSSGYTNIHVWSLVGSRSRCY